MGSFERWPTEVPSELAPTHGKRARVESRINLRAHALGASAIYASLVLISTRASGAALYRQEPRGRAKSHHHLGQRCQALPAPRQCIG